MKHFRPVRNEVTVVVGPILVLSSYFKKSRRIKLDIFLMELNTLQIYWITFTSIFFNYCEFIFIECFKNIYKMPPKKK